MTAKQWCTDSTHGAYINADNTVLQADREAGAFAIMLQQLQLLIIHTVV